MKTQTYILTGFLVVVLAIVGTYMFQQDNSSESETTSISQNEHSTQPQSIVSSAQKTAKEEPVTVKGKVSVSFE